ncbi:LAME_0A02454g1_1 [Lachancea meyersii CBS 8951]|uniref:LAME_0A02454g1_1 n=1 Tax=Lachancea meyersii CBS 8951 TaxID=1266667 RepID=A0A1G4IN55_9SACH|nr:LAME_0A02454g1_1 [Lachancea meyersii CBS 8951]
MLSVQGPDNSSEELAIALAIIKHRNPRLWEKAAFQNLLNQSIIFPSQNTAKLESIKYLAAKQSTRREVKLALVDRFLYRYVMGGSICRHLEPACNFLNGHRLAIGDLVTHLDIVKSLGCDVEEFEIAKQLLPNYKWLKWLFSVCLDDRNRQHTATHVVRSFQLVLASYYAFFANSTKAIFDLCQSLLLGFIKNEVLGFGASKIRIFKLLRDYTASRSIELCDVSLQHLSHEHSKMLALTLNFMIREEKTEAVVEIARFILKLMESLLVCLIKLKRSDFHNNETGRAFEDIYRARSAKMTYKYVPDFLEAAHPLGTSESLKRLKICTEFLLLLISSLRWVADTKVGLELVGLFQDYRPYLLGEILVLDDLDLITRFLQLGRRFEPAD